MTTHVVYDSGALIAVDRQAADMRHLHGRLRAAGVRPLIPGPVLTQVWRGGSRQHGLAAFTRQCDVFTGYTPDDYRRAGWMLGRAELPPRKHPDAVDALVVLTAVLHRTDVVVTSDPEDIRAYAATLGLKPEVITV
jgi:hypothetical protein